ncbi:MAG: hypothetical protein AAGJ93_06330 [Bacteroidota bacterium]
MKIITTLSFLLLSFLSLDAQNNGKHALSIGLSNDQFHFRTDYMSHIFSDNTAASSYQTIVERNKTIGFQLGYTYHLRERWQLSLRNNYSGDRFIAQRGIFDSLMVDDALIELPREHNRRYRINWTEALVFWAFDSPYYDLSLHLGTGVSYQIYSFDYRSGYSYDAQFEQYDYQEFQHRKGNSWGIPLQFQLQYPLNDQLYLGLNFRGNLFFNAPNQSGTNLYCAYRW